jgi:hypothetical protein
MFIRHSSSGLPSDSAQSWRNQNAIPTAGSNTERHLNALSLQPPNQVMQQGRAEWQVVLQTAIPGHSGHAGGALEEFADIQADQRRGHQSHGGKHAESPADVVGNREGPVALPGRQRRQFALLRGSHGDHPAGCLAPQFALQPFPHDQVRGHRLGGRSGLRDHNSQCAFRIHHLSAASTSEDRHCPAQPGGLAAECGRCVG